MNESYLEFSFWPETFDIHGVWRFGVEQSAFWFNMMHISDFLLNGLTTKYPDIHVLLEPTIGTVKDSPGKKQSDKTDTCRNFLERSEV